MATAISNWVEFNSWLFSNVPGLTVYATDPYNPPTRTLNIFQLARRNARKTSSAFYTARQINIGVYISAASRYTLETALDTLYKNLQGVEGTLVIPQSGTARQYTATLGAVKVNSQSGGLIDLTLPFECSDSYGYDTTYTLIYNLTNQTGSSLSYPFTQGGGADWQVPFIQLQYTAISGGTNATVTVGNQNTGQAISVQRTWAVGDLLQIDSRNRTVQVNGADVNFSGAFPEFQLGSQSFYYTDNFTTSRNFKLYAYVYNRWN